MLPSRNPTVVFGDVGHDDLGVGFGAQGAGLQQRPPKVHAAAVHVQARVHVVKRVDNHVQAAPERIVEHRLRNTTTVTHMCNCNFRQCFGFDDHVTKA